MDQSVISRAVTVAGGRFAPVTWAELTQRAPFEMVAAVLEHTCRVQRRVPDLPARVVFYLLCRADSGTGTLGSDSARRSIRRRGA